MAAIESLDSQIYKLTHGIAEDIIDTKGKEFAAYEEEIISADDLKKLAFLLLKKEKEGYSWLIENPGFKEVLFHFLNSEEDAEEDLPKSINFALIEFFREEMKRLVNYAIFENLQLKKEKV